MARPYVRRPKRQAKKFTLGFIKAARSSIAQTQDVVQRIGNAIIGGDFTGNARGESALDIQILRDNADDVASGTEAIVFGSKSRGLGERAIVFGLENTVDGIQCVGIGSLVNPGDDQSVAIGEQITGANGSVGAVMMGSNVSVGVDSPQAVAIGTFSSVGASAAHAIALGYEAQATVADEAVIAGTVLKLQTASSPLTKRTVITVPATPTTITGSRGGNAALANLLTELAVLGIIVDGTSA